MRTICSSVVRAIAIFTLGAVLGVAVVGAIVVLAVAAVVVLGVWLLSATSGAPAWPPGLPVPLNRILGR